MTVKQVADYLHLNEKKIYALVNDGAMPATKVTGKWLFPRELIDQWVMDASHSGLMSDRLLVAGADDPLMNRVMQQCSQQSGAYAFTSYTHMPSRQGLDLLQNNRLDVSTLHWGPAHESHHRHPALLQQYSHTNTWIMVHAFQRQHGFLLNPRSTPGYLETTALFSRPLRWSLRPQGSGAHRSLMEILAKQGRNEDGLEYVTHHVAERESAAAIVADTVDIALGTQATATEFNLPFQSLGWESFDLVLSRRVWFRFLFQEIVQQLKSQRTQVLAQELGGYNLENTGEIMWGFE